MRRAVPVVLGLLLVATGCGEDDPRADSARSTPSSTASSSAASPSDVDSSSAATAPPTPSVTPVTGKTFDSVAFTIVVPDGWRSAGTAQSGQITSAEFASPDQTTLLDLLRVVSGTSLTLDKAAKIYQGNRPGITRQPDREVGGQQVFVFTGSDDQKGTTYAVGAAASEGFSTIDFTFAPPSVTGKPDDPAAQQALVESFLATVRWKQ